MARVTEINSLEELAGRRLLWDLLLSQTREATFFQSLDWLLAYWRHFGQQQRLRVLIVEAADRPIGILPLTVIPESTRLGTVRVLTYPLDGWGTFFGPIGPNPTATLVAGLRHVQSTPQDWDLVDLRWIDARGIDAGRTAAALRSADLPAAQKPWQEVAQIELAGDWHSYWHSRDPDWRREIERTAPPPWRARRAELYPLSARGGSLRRRRPAVGPLRRLRRARPAELARLGHRRHYT